MRITLALLLASACMAETPAIPDALQAEYYRTDGQLVRAQQASKEAIEAVLRVCPNGFGMDPANPKKLACAPPPAPREPVK